MTELGIRCEVLLISLVLVSSSINTTGKGYAIADSAMEFETFANTKLHDMINICPIFLRHIGHMVLATIFFID